MTGNDHLPKSSKLEFILATVTPTPSLKIMEISEEASNTNTYTDVSGNSNDNIRIGESESQYVVSDKSQKSSATSSDNVENETVLMEERLPALSYFN